MQIKRCDSCNKESEGLYPEGWISVDTDAMAGLYEETLDDRSDYHFDSFFCLAQWSTDLAAKEASRGIQ